MEPDKPNRSQETPDGAGKPRARRRKNTPYWADALLVLLILGLVGLVYLSLQPGMRPVLDSEVKQGLHAIQLALERYAVDHHGQYPPYLIGGAGEYAEMVKVESGREVYTEPRKCPFPTQLTDPLVREGYLPSYPKNPFVRHISVHGWQMEYNDPLRNGTEEAKLHGTRFGPSCRLMGNVMADRRYAMFTLPRAAEPVRTYADTEYPCADFWPEDAAEPKPFLPGMFFYRSQSHPMLVSEGNAEPQIREPVGSYILGAYGGLRTKGKDVIGPDASGRNAFSPFGGRAGDDSVFGNPDGIRDAVILVLTPPEDIPPARIPGG